MRSVVVIATGNYSRVKIQIDEGSPRTVVHVQTIGRYEIYAVEVGSYVSGGASVPPAYIY